jgi:dihydroorotate dehydrogenase electron transfer subunit
MSINQIYKIQSNTPAAKNVYRMTLAGDTSAFTRPGQFLNIAIAGLYLRRPISVADYDAEGVTIYYKLVGEGTVRMSRMERGETLDVLVGLGNGFDVNADFARPLVVGGGVGTPPLYMLTRELIRAGKTPRVILGFNTADEGFLSDELRALGADVTVATADGSRGVSGFVTDALPNAGEYDYTFACGPEPMLRALYNAVGVPGQYSFEARMGCGFGACMWCSCRTVTGYKRICKDGPILTREEILWTRA